MHLKSIELSGFKSFAKNNVFKFDSAVSAIVGPNGSGKSNVAEAFRFVLGEQSIKSMRGKRGEDLIWNGATSEPRANRAFVKVLFDNTNKIFEIDFPEVSIERVVHRDGINEYLINGSPVRLKDIVELLAHAHIGATGHHIISQGEADRILNANPRERKNMVEDALGLKLYQYKRLESERKLKKTFENIAQVEALRKEIAPHIKFLRRQVEKLDRVESMRAELIKLAGEYFRNEARYLNFSKETIDEEKRPLEEKLEKLSLELTAAKKILEKAAKKEKREYAVLELESKLSETRIHKDALAREVGKFEGLVTSEERIIKKQKELILSDEHKMIYLKDVENLAQEIFGEKNDADVFERIKRKITEFIKGKKETTNSNTLLEAEEALRNYKEDKGEAEKKFEGVEEKEKKLKEEYELLKKEIETEKDSSRDAEKDVFRIMSEENEVISQLNILKMKEDKIGLEEAEFKRELEETSVLTGVGVTIYDEKEAAKGTKSAELFEERKVQEERKRLLEKYKVRLEDSSISGADDIYKEYKDTSERDTFLERELSDLDGSARTLSELIKELEMRLATEFASGLKKINQEFGKLFVTMFGGGEAGLVLTKEQTKKEDAEIETDEMLQDGEEEKTEEGIDIRVSLPKKKIKSLLMLSGGERALTSIALIFAISQVNPPPFLILDETDAALDESNSKKYGDLVEMFSKCSQLILITHNRETMSRAGVIYGVTMGSSGISKLLSISFEEAVEIAK